MSDKFLQTPAGNTDLTNGTANLFVQQLAVNSITPSKPVKSNFNSVLIGENLLINDVDGLQTALDNTLQNPLASNLEISSYSIVSGGEAILNVQGGDTNVLYGGESTGRIEMKSDRTSIWSPNQGGEWRVMDDNISLNIGGAYGFTQDAASGSVYLQAFDNSTKCNLDNGQVRLYASPNSDYTVVANTTVTELLSPNGSNSLSVTNSDTNIYRGTTPRLVIDNTDTTLYGGDGDSSVEVTNNSVLLSVDAQNIVQVDTNGIYLSGFNGQMDFSIRDATFGLLVQDQSGERLRINNTHSRMYPPDESKGYLELIDTKQSLNFGGVDRLLYDATNSDIYSPNGLNRERLTNSAYSVNFNGSDRISLTSTDSKYLAPSSNNGFYASSTETKAYFSAGYSFVADATETLIQHSNASWWKARVAELFGAVSTITRFYANGTATQLLSPDNLQTLSVANSGCTFNTGSNSNLLPTGRGVSGQGLQTDGAGALSWAYRDRMVFTQTATATVANTLTETSLLGSGVGSLTIPANTLISGSFIKFRVSGFGDIFNTNSITLRVKINGTTIQTITNSSAMAPSVPWELFTYFTCYTTGAGGTAHHYGRLDYEANKVVVCSTATFALNTTIANTFSLTIQHGVANAQSTWTSTQCDLFLHV